MALTDEQQAEMDDLNNTWHLARVLPRNMQGNLVVVGAYKGKVMQWLAENNPYAKVVGYEPQLWAVVEAEARLAQYEERCFVAPYALGVWENKQAALGDYHTDACSLLSEKNEPGSCEIRDAQVLLGRMNFELLVMNIEGYEWELLPYLYGSGILKLGVKRLAVQFHEEYAPCVAEQADLLYRLDELYPSKFNYFLPSWGYWYGRP